MADDKDTAAAAAIAVERSRVEEDETHTDVEQRTQDDKVASSSATTPVATPPYTIFSHAQVIAIVAFASWAASFSGLSSNIYFPAISAISVDLNVTPELVNITVTLYLIFQGLSPSLWAPLSDTKGRRLVTLITFTLYIGANIGLALTKSSYAQLAVLRAVQSSGSASSVAIGAAIVGDVTDIHQRAGYMGIFTASSLFATAVGPLIGGAISQNCGWQTIFWLLTGYAGAFFIVAVVLMPETMRKIVGNGGVRPTGIARCPTYPLWISDERYAALSEHDKTVTAPPRKFTALDVLRPIKLLLHANVSLCVFYMSLHYAVWQMSVTAMSTFFARRYGLNSLKIGLTFLGNGGGSMIGTFLAGLALDALYRRAKRRADRKGKTVMIASARLDKTWVFSAIQSASILVFGWSVDKHVHISVPIIVTFFSAASLCFIQVAITTFLVDSFPDQSASANATLNLTRCLLAAAGTSAILPMGNAMGIGWAFTLLTFLLLASNAMIVWQLHAEARKEK